MTKIAILGSGIVGESLAAGFLAKGHAVMRASREPGTLADWKSAAKGEAATGTFGEAAAWGEVVILAVKGTAGEALVGELAKALAGKVVVDAMNPIADEAPENGVLRYFTGPNDSLMERLQRAVPAARFVKAWNSVGAHFMVNPPFQPTPTMFICGNDAAAKQQVAGFVTAFGWESLDVGGVELARPLEALCQLWCAPGFLRNDWKHAFKYLT